MEFLAAVPVWVYFVMILLTYVVVHVLTFDPARLLPAGRAFLGRMGSAVLLLVALVLFRREEPLTLLLALGLAALGGFEIATMVGSVLQAASERRVIVVDGFIASSAVLVASRVAPPVLQRCVFAHRSDERGHARLLELLGVKPLLDLGLRVGEGSGAALAWPLLESACRIINEMASFESAGVSDKG